MQEFVEFNLDYRVSRAIQELGWLNPTEIQKEALPLALKGENLLIRSRTGSGKTAIYLIAIFQRILSKNSSKFKALIFAPSNELCSQIYEFVCNLAKYTDIRVINLSATKNSDLKVIEENNIIVATPTKSLNYLKEYPKNKYFKFVVFDEADLLFTFGHREALEKVANILQNRIQVVILSATLNEDVENLCVVNLVKPKRIVASNEPFPDSCQLSQYLIKCQSNDRFLILYSLFSLSLINGKTLIFTNNTNSSYRILMFLRIFGINCVVLNSELPINCRKKAIDKFSKSKVKVMVSTDIAEESDNSDFSLSRGIDFACVDNVVNFDFPSSVTNYIHRVGRTARVESVGLAFTFYSNDKEELLEELRTFIDKNSNSKLLPFRFKVEYIEGFRYRVEDAIKSITKSAIFKTRKAEIKEEIYQSEKVRDHFKNQPADKLILKSKFNRSAQKMNHLKRIPEYLIPDSLKNTIQPKLNNTFNFNEHKRKDFMKKKFQKLRKHRRDPLSLPLSKRNVGNF